MQFTCDHSLHTGLGASIATKLLEHYKLQRITGMEAMIYEVMRDGRTDIANAMKGRITNTLADKPIRVRKLEALLECAKRHDKFKSTNCFAALHNNEYPNKPPLASIYPSMPVVGPLANGATTGFLQKMLDKSAGKYAKETAVKYAKETAALLASQQSRQNLEAELDKCADEIMRLTKELRGRAASFRLVPRVSSATDGRSSALEQQHARFSG